MRRFLTTSFIALALVVLVAGAAPAAHAQTITGANAATAYTTCIDEGNTAAQCQQAYDAYLSASQVVVDYKPDSSSDSTYGFVMIKIMSLFAWLLGVAALTLDYSVYYTVVSMGTYVHNLAAVGTTWRILRDIGNIALIFGFLAIGISVSLNTERLGYGKKMLPMLIVAAVFLNFSLFFSEAIIDAGNLFATQFYTQINGGSLPSSVSLSATNLNNEVISNKIMSQLGLQTIYGDALNQKKELFSGAKPWFIGFMGILLFIMAAFVMFSLAFILIARFVILLFLIIIAPIGFAGLAVPQLAGKAQQWWDALFEQTLTAPILLLLLYIALAVITDVKFLTGFGGGNADWTGSVTNNLAGFASVMLSFLVAMGLLFAVVIISKRLGAFGAGWATKTAGALTFGATALGMRSTAGWGANKTAKYLRGTRLARVPFVGTGAVKGLERVAASNFDIRSTQAFKNLPFGGIDAGQAQKGGYKAELKARTESRTKYAKGLTGRELTAEEKSQQAMLQSDIMAGEKDLTQRKAQQAHNAERGEIDEDLNQQIKTLEGASKERKERLEKLESVTDKGAQRKYATALEFGLGEKSAFNKFFNFAANTEAATKIRQEVKKSSDEKTLEALKAALKKAGEEGKSEAKPEAGH